MSQRSSVDLRERMQRVASKPRRSRPTVVPSLAAESDAAAAGDPVATSASDVVELARAAAPRRRRTTPVAPRHPAPAPRSRVDTLREWAAWELGSVPSRRWEWVKALVRGR